MSKSIRSVVFGTAMAAAMVTMTTSADADLIIVGGSAGSTPASNDVIGVTSGFFGANILLTSDSKLVFEFLGKEAGFKNIFTAPGGSFTTGLASVGDYFSNLAAAGLLDFRFDVSNLGTFVLNGANNPVASPPSFFATQAGLGSSMVIVGLDDGGGGGGTDFDFDDLVVKITASRIPEPTALAIFALGLAGLGFMGWRRTAAAA